MELDKYQDFTDTTAAYPDVGRNLLYPILGLAGETGEVAEKLKKVIRDHNGKWSTEQKINLAKELGDVLWYIARIARELGVPLSKVAELNMVKLSSRKARNAIGGSGDDR